MGSTEVQSKNPIKIVEVPSSFKFHTFETEVMDRKILYQVIKMLDSVFVVVNYQNSLQFKDLSLAMLDNRTRQPISTQLMGDSPLSTTKNVGMRLAKKLKVPVYFSCNIEDSHIMLAVEKYLYEEIKKFPDKF